MLDDSCALNVWFFIFGCVTDLGFITVDLVFLPQLNFYKLKFSMTIFMGL